MEVQLASWNCRIQWCVHLSLRSDKTNKIKNRVLHHLHIFSNEQPATSWRGAVWNPNRANGGTLVRIYRGWSHPYQARPLCLHLLTIETAGVEYKKIYIVGDNHKSRPEELDFPNTMTDIDYHTWMLSGSAVMRDGQVCATNCFGKTIFHHGT